jgi:hypothetical protein
MHLVETSVGEYDIMQRIKILLQEHKFLNMVREGLQQEHGEKKYEGYQRTKNELLMYNNRLYVHDLAKLKNFIMNTFHQRPDVGHPSYHKIITIVRKLYY